MVPRRLILYPYGDEPETGKASLYVKSLNASAMNAKYRLAVMNHLQSSNSISKSNLKTSLYPCDICFIMKGGDQKFCQREEWGDAHFIDADALQSRKRGFLNDGWIVIVAEMNVDESKPSHRPKHSESWASAAENNFPSVDFYDAGQSPYTHIGDKYITYAWCHF